MTPLLSLLGSRLPVSLASDRDRVVRNSRLSDALGLRGECAPRGQDLAVQPEAPEPRMVPRTPKQLCLSNMPSF